MSSPVFLSGNLMRHVSVMSFTASVGILCMFAVDFVDVLFISMLGDKDLTAAIGYAATLLFFANAIGIGLAITAVSLVARNLGARDYDRARDYATSTLTLTILISILVPALAWGFIRDLLEFLGAEGAALDHAVTYVQIILPFMFFIGGPMVMMAFLRAHGAARRSMSVMIIGSLVNAALDPIFIFVFEWGIVGAATASVIGRVTMMSVGTWLVLRHYDAMARFSFKTFVADFFTLLAIAVPAMLTNLATPVGNALVTRELASFGAEAVAGMAVIGRLTPLAFSVVLALSGAVGPIVGQNFGAKLYDRVRQTFINGLIFTALYVAGVSVVLYVLGDFIVLAFDASGEMARLILLFCGPLALLQFFNGAIFVCNACFNNLGKPIYSTCLNWSRHTLGTLPFALWGASIWGASGVLIGQAVGGLFFALIGIAITWRLMGRLGPTPRLDRQVNARA